MSETRDGVGAVALHALMRSAISGDRRALARVLSRIEDGGVRVRLEVAAMLPAVTSRVIGLTGPGGAGKSTLTAQLATAPAAPSPIAVLSVDPSSPRTGGALLGDRVRLGTRASQGVFWRSMATRGSSDALAAAVPEVLAVLGACGFETVILETAGAGQDQFAVAGLVQTLVVVVAPGFGDDVQAEKAGLMELADIVVVNQRDRPGARVLHRQVVDAVRHRASIRPGWQVPVIATEATSAEGIAELQAAMDAHGTWRREVRGSAAQETPPRELLRRVHREMAVIVQLWLDEQVRAPQSVGADRIAQHTANLLDGRATPLQVALALVTEMIPGASSLLGIPTDSASASPQAGPDHAGVDLDRSVVEPRDPSCGGSRGEGE